MLALGAGGGYNFRSDDDRKLHLDSYLPWLLLLPLRMGESMRESRR
jgi:hypothetical protein